MIINIRENKVHRLPNGATIPTTFIKTLSRDHFGEVPACGDYIRWDGALYEVIAREWKPGISGAVDLTVRTITKVASLDEAIASIEARLKRLEDAEDAPVQVVIDTARVGQPYRLPDT